ncbi:unnamed protein product [Arctogadus glacialis]
MLNSNKKRPSKLTHQQSLQEYKKKKSDGEEHSVPPSGTARLLFGTRRSLHSAASKPLYWLLEGLSLPTLSRYRSVNNQVPGLWLPELLLSRRRSAEHPLSLVTRSRTDAPRKLAVVKTSLMSGLCDTL